MRNGGQTLPQAAVQLKPAGPAEHMGIGGTKYSNVQSKQEHLVYMIIASVLKFRFSVKTTEIWKNRTHVFTVPSKHYFFVAFSQYPNFTRRPSLKFSQDLGEFFTLTVPFLVGYN